MGRSPLEAAAWEGGHTQGGDFWRRELVLSSLVGEGRRGAPKHLGESRADLTPHVLPDLSRPAFLLRCGASTHSHLCPGLGRSVAPLPYPRPPCRPPRLLPLRAHCPGQPAAQAAHAFLRARFVSVSPASFLALVPCHLLGFAQGRMAFRGLSSRVSSSCTPGLAGPGRGAGLSSTRPGGLRCRLGPGGRVWGLLWHTAPGRPPAPRLAAFCSLFPELSPFLVLMNGPLTARVFSRASPHEGRPVR